MSTDHCPFDFHGQKELGRGDFRKVPNGLPGVEDRVNLMHSGGVVAGHLTPNRWVEVLSTAPARIFGLEGRKGVVAVGADADLVVYDPNAKHTISATTHHMDVDYSTYEGWEVTGHVETVLSRGKVIVDGDEWLGAAGDGRFLKRSPTGAVLARSARLIEPLPPPMPRTFGLDCFAPSNLPNSEDAPVNRRLILASLLAMLLAACGQQESSEPDATLTPEATPEATSDASTPSDEPAASEDDGSASGDLADVIPDELNGVPATEIPGMDQILASALQAQGLDSGGADFAFVTYGTDADAVVLNAFRLPGVSEVAMEQLARLMSGAGTDVDAESVTIGGKTVLKISGGQTGGAVYFYVADDTAFTAAGQDEALIEQLLSQLP